ncbi:unnamed protein product [Angiostrongylus costaricensis]|uniref:MADS-box domain-containing protein n=1 Tax=Angiostrongylus costaricensis TaxID=334426 RepID=A0A0R3PVH9_ANGCS|nr:unnamed protein product [Angiostrongylus costaricensis]
MIKEDLKEGRAAVMVEAVEARKSIRKAHRIFANCKTEIIALRLPDGTVITSIKTMEQMIHGHYWNLYNSHVLLLSYKIKENEHVVPPVLTSEIRQAISSVKNRTTPGPGPNNIRMHEELFASSHKHTASALHAVPVWMQEPYSVEDQQDRVIVQEG